MLDAARRRDIILHDARNLAMAQGLDLVEDPGLLEEVGGLVEWPVVLMGSFNEAFLSIPPEVIRATIRVNQKCFVLKRHDGALANRFILVSNIEASDHGKTIIGGNERVIAARLSDAKFFYETDLKVELEDRLPKLEKIVFHEKLGTQGERVKRIAALATELAPLVGADVGMAERAANLCKTDLVTEMVGEFPELQGLMGRYYATEQREYASVAAACEEHYKPQGPSDRVPSDPVSIAVALADKIDTLVGFWAIDEKPTGSKDPYALRRAALGVIRLILENGLRLPLLHVLTSYYGWLLADMTASLGKATNPYDSFLLGTVQLKKLLPIQFAYLERDATFREWFELLMSLIEDRKQADIDSDSSRMFTSDPHIRNSISQVFEDGTLPTETLEDAFSKLERTGGRIVSLVALRQPNEFVPHWDKFSLNWIARTFPTGSEQALIVSETLRGIEGQASDLLSFFIDRLKVYLRDRGARYQSYRCGLGRDAPLSPCGRGWLAQRDG